MIEFCCQAQIQIIEEAGNINIRVHKIDIGEKEAKEVGAFVHLWEEEAKESIDVSIVIPKGKALHLTIQEFEAMAISQAHIFLSRFIKSYPS